MLKAASDAQGQWREDCLVAQVLQKAAERIDEGLNGDRSEKEGCCALGESAQGGHAGAEAQHVEQDVEAKNSDTWTCTMAKTARHAAQESQRPRTHAA